MEENSQIGHINEKEFVEDVYVELSNVDTTRHVRHDTTTLAGYKKMGKFQAFVTRLHKRVRVNTCFSV